MTRGLSLAPRGRVLMPARGVVLGRTAGQDDLASASWRVLVVLGMLPMFAQCFHYMVDIPPLYLLSKLWPFLMAPAAVWAMASLDIPARLIHLALLVWLLAATPLISIANLGNNFPDAMATTVKVWPFTYVFSLAAILAWARPERATLRAQILGLGIG